MAQYIQHNQEILNCLFAQDGLGRHAGIKYVAWVNLMKKNRYIFKGKLSLDA